MPDEPLTADQEAFVLRIALQLERDSAIKDLDKAIKERDEAREALFASRASNAYITGLVSKFRCKACGCLWRLNPPTEIQPDGSWSLFDGSQKPGQCCDNAAMDLEIVGVAPSRFERIRALVALSDWYEVDPETRDMVICHLEAASEKAGTRRMDEGFKKAADALRVKD